MSRTVAAPRYRWDTAQASARSFWQRLSAPQMFVLSFLLLDTLGTVGLKVLPGLYTGEPLTWVDALFTSTSACCVTGLIVVDTATYFTPAGQAWVLLLIQLGGLGMITFTSLIFTALGRRLSLRSLSLAGVDPEAAPHIDPRRMVVDGVLFTFGFEAAGALALYAFWAPELGWGAAVWPAVFHSVSAFCNAGFSTFTDNLIPFQRNPGVLVVIMLLIVIGGIGFLTLEEVALRLRAGRHRHVFRVSLHSRLVLVTTGLLILAGAVALGMGEWNRTLGHLGVGHKVTNSLLLSVTPRTAGFNSIDYGQASETTNFVTVLLMMVGGSPGSTAGGFKTTTLALVSLLAWSRLRGLQVTSVAGRSLRDETLGRAVGLFVMASAVVTVGVLLLTVTEASTGKGDFLSRLFEVASAFNTVGLTMGETPHLTASGKVLLSALMLLGRVGPLTLGAAVTLDSDRGAEFRYAYEEVMIG